MPKLKTHSGAKKRFNLTKSGKVKRAHAFKSHILTKKDTKRGRRLRSRHLRRLHQRGDHPQDDPLQIRDGIVRNRRLIKIWHVLKAQ